MCGAAPRSNASTCETAPSTSSLTTWAARRCGIATGCRRLVIELCDHDELASLVVGALDAIGAPSANVQPQIKPAPPEPPGPR